MKCKACNIELTEIDSFDNPDEDMCSDCLSISHEAAYDEFPILTEDHLSLEDMSDLGINIGW